MKTKIIILFLLMSICGYAQNNKTPETSDTRKFIKNANAIRINKDWTLIAEFRSGIGETVQFFPIQIVDIKTGIKQNALQVDLKVNTKNLGASTAILGGLIGGLGSATNNPLVTTTGGNLMAQSIGKDGVISLYVDKDQVDEMITFLEQNIIPNLNTKYQDKSSEFIFTAKEIIFKFLIHEKKKRLSIILNDQESYEFWTESRAEEIEELIPLLKKVNTKELDF